MSKPTKEDREALTSAFNDVSFLKMWHKMHTPQIRKFRKVGRNEICPFCNSGKKFKNCECYATHKDLEIEETFEDKVIRINKEEAEQPIGKELVEKVQEDTNTICKAIREGRDMKEVEKERNIKLVKPLNEKEI